MKKILDVDCFADLCSSPTLGATIAAVAEKWERK
jgi:hypothetical protein